MIAVKMIRVVHPTAGEALIPEVSLPHHVRAGWRRAAEPDEPRVVQSEQEPSPRRRRVAEQKSEES